MLFSFIQNINLSHFVYSQPYFSFCNDFRKEKFRILLKTVKLTYLLSYLWITELRKSINITSEHGGENIGDCM